MVSYESYVQSGATAAARGSFGGLAPTLTLARTGISARRRKALSESGGTSAACGMGFVRSGTV